MRHSITKKKNYKDLAISLEVHILIEILSNIIYQKDMDTHWISLNEISIEKKISTILLKEQINIV